MTRSPQDSLEAINAAKPVRRPFFRRLMPSREFYWLTATYRHKTVEAKYQEYLVEDALPKERFIFFLCTIVYFLYGFLDFLVITENLEKVITVRWLICTPVALALIGLTYVKFLKRYFTIIITFGVFVASISVVWMIGNMTAENPPPYIVGILAVFIFAACTLHMPFPAAAATFIITAASYSAIILINDSFSRTDVISGLFFMTSSALLAIVTNYVQEIRWRIIWRQDLLRKLDAQKIEELLIEATAADQSKINFLSMMSHEMRTPLHQIIGYSEIVKTACSSNVNDNESEAHLQQINESAQTMLSRIKKMLLYADTRGGKIVYDSCDTDIHELIAASLEQTRATIEKKQLRIDTAGVNPATVYVDIFHTCYALNNIIENAVNASSTNAPLLFFGNVTQDGGYELTVEDEGFGMSQEQIDRALKPFTQSENALNRSYEGLGLGLTLAKKIFDDQNTGLEIKSQPSVGTKIRITFPGRDTSTATASAAAE